MSQGGSAYHHGDLRAACLRAARELLEEDGAGGLSMRAVARRAGVSATAPYRHFADREALVSAVAAQGYVELAGRLSSASPAPATGDDLAAIAVAHVRFALDHPALFRTMFVEPCDPTNPERAEATSALTAYVTGIVVGVFPHADAEALPTAVWAFVHGLAMLHLDGKLDASTPAVVTDQVQSAVHALLTVNPAPTDRRR